MGLWVFAILTVLMHSTTAQFNITYWGLENEALIVSCSRHAKDRYPVDWYYSKTNEIITTQERSRVFASGERLKFLPSKASDSGIYTCIIRRYHPGNCHHLWPHPQYDWICDCDNIQKESDCNSPHYFKYAPTVGTRENSKIFCPTIDNYNWTAPLKWLKNCKTLQGIRYYPHKTFLLIQNATSDDAGDYTCKFMHNENGVNYIVTATRSFKVKGGNNFSLLPVIRAPRHNDTIEVEIGNSANITCSACIGKGFQNFASVQWYANESKVRDLGETRIHEEKEQNQSSSNELTCLNTILRISDVKEEDLSLKFTCLAYNMHGLRRHTITLRQKKPIDHRSIYHILAGFSMLLILICVLVIMLKVFWIDFILLWRDMARPYKTRDDGKIYDAYVIYPRNYKASPENTNSVEYFVHQILPDVLENKCGYNLCIYGRDLLPGEARIELCGKEEGIGTDRLIVKEVRRTQQVLHPNAITAVETSIQRSRRHIFILTPGAAESKEFAYEQQIALHRDLIQSDSKAILIEMEALNKAGRLPSGQPEDSLQHLMKVQGTIKWRDDHVANKRSLNSRFWKRVRYQMPVPNKLSKKDFKFDFFEFPQARMLALRCCSVSFWRSLNFSKLEDASTILVLGAEGKMLKK